MIPDGIDPHKAPLCSHGDPITVSATTAGEGGIVGGNAARAGACSRLRYAILRSPPSEADAMEWVAARCALADGSIG